MQLSVSSTYQPNENEVWVDFRSTLDDLTTPAIPDVLEVILLIEATDLTNVITYIPISKVNLDSSYVRPDRNFEIVFRNPERTMDLWVEARATYAGTTVVKRVVVGAALPSHASMDLPDNAIYSLDVLEQLATGGGNSNTLPNHNIVTLAPELRDTTVAYDFTVANPAEDYDGLIYMGGGNRLLIQNQTNQFESQLLDQSPWSINGFMFLEPAASNFAANAFFLNTQPIAGQSASGVIPLGYTFDNVGAICQSTVDFNYQISAAAKVWTIRLVSPGGFSYVNQAARATLPVISNVLPGDVFTFSAYTQVKLNTTQTKANDLFLTLQWMDGVLPLTPTTVNLDATQFGDMGIASLTGTAPPDADSVVAWMAVGSVDAGDDLTWTILAPQVEIGPNVTTRVSNDGQRQTDEIIIDGYDAANQKIFMQMIAGFKSGVEVQLVEGPINLFFHADNTFEAAIPGEASLLSPMEFNPGDVLALTIISQAGKSLQVYRDGQLLAEQPLDNFSTPVGPLTILGAGVELMKLSVFSR